MLRFVGPVQAIVSAVEPKLSEMAVNRHNNNIFYHHHPHKNFILAYSQYTNFTIFMIIFMLCAIEVIFVKIVTAINTEDERIEINNSLLSPPLNLQLLSNRQYILTGEQEQQFARQRSIFAHLISTQVQQNADDATSSYTDSNNNEHVFTFIGNDDNNNNIE